MSNVDMVNHPPHYQSKSGLETIDIIDACVEDLTGIEAVLTGNVIKYISRWKKKGNPLEDLKKARWYLNKLIDSLETKDVEETFDEEFDFDFPEADVEERKEKKRGKSNKKARKSGS